MYMWRRDFALDLRGPLGVATLLLLGDGGGGVRNVLKRGCRLLQKCCAACVWRGDCVMGMWVCVEITRMDWRL